MAEKVGSPYRSSNSGELSPEAGGRVDVKQFYSAGLRFKNVEPVPLSGFRGMAGSFDLGPVRGRVAPLAQNSIVVTPGPWSGAQVIWQANVAGKVVAVDCAILVSTVGVHQVQAQVLVGVTWVNLSSPITAGTNARAITMAAGPRKGLNAAAVRLLVIFSAAATITTGAVTILTETDIQDAPRYDAMRHDSGARYALSLQAQFLDIFEDDVFVGGSYLPSVAPSVLPFVDFYSENATIGIAQNSIETLRVRRGGNSFEWVRDLWPFTGIPKVDLGGVYPKINDVWDVQITFTGSPLVSLSLTVNGENTAGIPFINTANVPVAIDALVDVALMATKIKTALEALPSLGATVTVVVGAVSGQTRTVNITFGGALSGSEYQLNSTITNTAAAAALASHVVIGKTTFELLLSPTRGYAGVFGFSQDRQALGDIKAIPAVVLFSQGGEYFTLNIEAAGASAARADKLRGGQVSERVLGFAEATYFLIGTDRKIYFASNRTINKTDPLNYIECSDVGMVPNCLMVKLENTVYYVGTNPEADPPRGSQILSFEYSTIDTNFRATPEHIFASHLIDGLIRSKGQKSASKLAASKIWVLRDDGRLVAGCIIKTQGVLGYCEWILADGGQAREIHVDAGNDLRMAVLRGSELRHERQDYSTLFQASVRMTPDLAGVIRGLNFLEGRDVWAEVEGRILGPFTVKAGTVDLGDAYVGPVLLGLWQAPLWESMPRVMITRNDEIVRRPGRVHGIRANVIDTTSIAIGANNQPPEDVPLTSTQDAVNGPVDGKSTSVLRVGIPGFVMGTTGVITQTRPGRLHVRDLEFQEKL
jgi:hypothetical protein